MERHIWDKEWEKDKSNRKRELSVIITKLHSSSDSGQGGKKWYETSLMKHKDELRVRGTEVTDYATDYATEV